MKIAQMANILTGVVVAIMVTVVLVPIVSEVTSNISTSSPSLDSVAGPLPYVFVAIILLSAVAFIGSGGPEKIQRFLDWRAFGNRLKEGYVAKFGQGGESKVFNEEVDMHIKAMKALGPGITKDINKDWLKRMAAFVEVPFAIPEEEGLSEEDKTRTFRDEKGL